MTRRASVIALSLLACACTSDLALPSAPQRQAPELSGLRPEQAFAGERVVLEGANLGGDAATRVLVGGVPALVVPGAAPAGGVTVLMPSGLPDGALEVRVATAGGEDALPGALHYLGPGHPEGFSLTVLADLGADSWFVDVSGDDGFLLDVRHNAILRVDPRTGNPLAPPVHAGGLPEVTFGPLSERWVWSMGMRDRLPELRRFDFTADPPRQTCGTGALAQMETDRGTAVRNAAASPDGRHFAVPTGGYGVLVATLDRCPPGVRVVALPGRAVGAVSLDGGEVVAALEDRFVRIAPDGTVDAGPACDFDARPVVDVAFAPDFGGKRLAYARNDADVGFVSWAEPGPPRLAGRTAFTYENVFALGFGAAGPGAPADRLYASTWGRVVAWEVPPTGGSEPAVVASVPLQDPRSLAALPTDEMLVAIPRGTALLSRAGAVLRDTEVGTNMPAFAIALGPDGRVIVPTFFGTHALDGDLSTYEASYSASGIALALDGATNSGGLPVGWMGNKLLEYSPQTHTLESLAELAAGRRVISAARSADGRFAAALTRDEEDVLRLEGVEQGGGTRCVPVGGDSARLLFAEGLLQVAVQSGRDIELRRHDPASLAQVGAPVAIETALAAPRVRLPYWSRALDAVLLPVSDSRDYGNGTLDYFQAVYFAVRVAEGVVARTEAPVGRAFASPRAISPDGRVVACVTPDRSGVNAMTVERDGDSLVMRRTAHLDAPDAAADAIFSARGDRLYLVFPGLDSVGMVQ